MNLASDSAEAVGNEAAGNVQDQEDKMKPSARYIIIAILSVAVIVAIGGYAFVWRPRQAATANAEDTRSAVVTRGTMEIAVLTSGQIKSEERVDLTFPTPGRVVEVTVEVGDRVEAGAVLARLDTEQLQLQRDQAQAALNSAQAHLDQLRSPARAEEIASAEANLRAAEAQVNAAAADLARLTSGATDAQIAAAEADFASAWVQKQAAEEAHEATMKCFTVKLPYGQGEKKICPALGAPEEQARYNLNAAEKALAAAQAQLDELLAGGDAESIQAARANLAAAQAQRDAAQAQLDLLKAGTAPEQITAAEAQVAQAEAGLEAVELTLEQATLRAPFDGVVAAVHITPGEMPPTGLPAITLLDDSAFRLVAQADEMDVGQLIPGQSAQVTVEAFPDVTIPGTLQRIAPAATMEGGVVYYELTIMLDPTDLPLRADMTANATILVDELEDVLLLPTWVVRVDRNTGQTYVNQRVNGQVVRTDITVGVRHDGFVQILSGLSEGEEVIWVNESGFGFGL